MRLPGVRAGRHLPARRPDHRGGAAGRRRRDPPRLRLPRRERRLRPRGAGRRPDLDRPVARGDRGDGLQDRVQAPDGRRPGCRCSTGSTRPRVTEAELPVLVKASAGGGGRGMRIVRTLAELAGQPWRPPPARPPPRSAIPPSSASVTSTTGHHVEVQILADAHGTVWALGERECSLQRRHQKVIEEAPAPLVDRLGGDLRERLLAAGRDAAAAVGYRGAGTVEFLADDNGRLLVPRDEHPPAGRTPGHRVRHRHRPGRPATRRRRRAAR